MGIGNRLQGGTSLSGKPGAPSKPTVLFVDDEENILNGIRRFMRTRRELWSSKFACGGADAIDILRETKIDLVITDMRMPGVDGAALLEWISSEKPGIIRFVLSGEADVAETYRIVGRSHQYFSKPCAPEKLAETIATTLVGPLTQDGMLRSDTASFLDLLQTHPDVFKALGHCLERPDVAPSDAAAIISTDPSLSARVLQLVNSAYFGRPLTTTNVERAVRALGLDHLRALVAKDRLGQSTKDVGKTRNNEVFAPLADAARAFGTTKTENPEILDTIYATALFSGLGSPIERLPKHAQTSHAAFAAALLGLPERLISALSNLHEMQTETDKTDRAELICSSVFRSFGMADGGQIYA